MAAAATTFKPRPAGLAEVPIRRRLKPGLRRQLIVDEAARLFAESGFGGRTRELARRLGVTQALLYRYFPTKEALIDAVFAAVFQGRGDRPPTLAAEPSVHDLKTRLTTFYVDYLARASFVSMRLFVRANLDGRGLARRVSVPLTERVLRPVVAELRQAAGLPDFERRPMMRGERELAMMLHGSVVFLGIRKYVYVMPMPDDLSDVVAMQVRAYLPGALAEIRRLHADPEAHPTLAVRQLERRAKS